MPDLGYEVDLAPQAAKKDGESDQPRGMTLERAASYWTQQLVLAEREHKPYWAEVDQIIDTYRTARSKKNAPQRRRMNILYANTETVRGAIYGRSGKPDLRQRFPSKDQLARDGAEILERCLAVSIDTRQHEDAIKSAVMYAILAGRGVVRIDYEPTMAMVPVETMIDPLADPLVPPPPPTMEEKIVAQKIIKMSVEPRDFLHSPARQWSEVWWVAFRHRMTRDDLVNNTFNKAKEVPLNWVPSKDGKPDTNATDDVRRAEVWEVWSVVHKQRFFVVREFATALRIDEDPYGLEGFWPMAQPLALIPTLGNVVPALEWHQYQRLADDLEETTNRIAILTAAMKRRGVRDAAITELEKLAKANDNEFIAVKDYQQFVTKGGLAQAFQTEDLRPIVETMMHLYKAKTEQEATIDKMTGIADIMRGESDSSATATAENIKAQYGGLRIKTRQKEVEAFIRDNMRIEAEMIAEHFEADILFKMTEIEVSDELIAMLRDDHARRYKIDIETDSTVFEDAEGQKAATSEAITASVSLMREGVGMMQVAPEMGEVIFEMLTMALKTMKGGRSIEEVIDRARQAMQQRISAPPPEQQPDPIAEADKARAEAAQFDAQSKMELTDLKMQAGREKHAQTMERMQANRMFSDFEPPMTGAVQ